MGRLDNVLAQLRREAASAGAAGYGSFEADGNFEAVANFLVTKKGFSRADARSMAAEAMNKPGVMNAITAEMGPGGLRGLSNTQTNGNVPGRDVAAQLKLTVTRVTANIVDAPLPFAMFGAQDYVNGYRNTLTGQLLPAGVTLVSVTGGEVSGKPNRVDFTYTDGVNSDVVEVTSSTYPYPSLLNSTSVDLLRMSKIRMELSDNTQAAQFRQDIQTVSNSPFGKGSTNKISATAFRRPDQFQAGIVDLDAVFEIDKETSIVSSILPVAGFEVTFNSFVEKFYRQITKGHW